VLDETRCGACYEHSVDDIARDLLAYLRGTPPVWFNPDLAAIERYSRKYQADLLMKLMRNETSRNETLEFLESLGDSHLKDISPDLLKEYKIMVRNRDMFI
jgi:hypothetical protein